MQRISPMNSFVERFRSAIKASKTGAVRKLHGPLRLSVKRSSSSKTTGLSNWFVIAASGFVTFLGTT